MLTDLYIILEKNMMMVELHKSLSVKYIYILYVF